MTESFDSSKVETLEKLWIQAKMRFAAVAEGERPQAFGIVSD